MESRDVPYSGERDQASPDQGADEPLLESATADAQRRNPNRPLEAVRHEAPEAEPQPGLPHPSFGFAILWTLLPLAAQIVVGIGLSMAAALVFVAVTQRPHEVAAFLNGEFQIILIPVGTLTTLVVALAVCAILFGRRMSRCLGWRGLALHQWISVLLIACPLAIIASEVTNWMSQIVPLFEPQWLSEFRRAGGEVFDDLSGQSFLLVFIAGCLLPGLGEEIYCRGFLSRGLVAHYGVILGTLLASLLFGAMHIDPVRSCGAFFLGLGLQFVFLATRSLAAPIALHTLNNTLAFLAIRFRDQAPIPGVTPMPDGQLAHTPPFLMLASAASCAALLALLVQTRTRWILPDGSRWSPGYVTAELPPATLGARPLSARPRLVFALAVLVTYAAMLAALVWAQRGAAA